MLLWLYQVRLPHYSVTIFYWKNIEPTTNTHVASPSIGGWFHYRERRQNGKLRELARENSKPRSRERWESKFSEWERETLRAMPTMTSRNVWRCEWACLCVVGFSWGSLILRGWERASERAFKWEERAGPRRKTLKLVCELHKFTDSENRKSWRCSENCLQHEKCSFSPGLKPCRDLGTSRFCGKVNWRPCFQDLRELCEMFFVWFGVFWRCFSLRENSLWSR